MQKKPVFGATAGDLFLSFLTKYSPKLFLCYTQVLKNHSFMKSIRKRKKLFWINSIGNRQKQQKYLQRKAHNVGKRYNNNFNTAY